MNRKITFFRMLFVKSFLLIPLLFLTFCQKEDATINNEVDEAIFTKTEQLVNLMKLATKNDSDDEDEQCVKFQYPVVFFVQLDASQPIDIVTINSDDDLYAFFDTLSVSNSIRIDFPMVLIGVDGEETTINSLEELIETLEVIVGACRGDDNNYDYCHDNNKKVYICHNGKTICVSINAIKAHLDHGDELGKCDN